MSSKLPPHLKRPTFPFATMLMQSNDLFVSPAGSGIPLFDADDKPIVGQFVTNRLKMWDAGTEANEVPGEGAYQAPRQSNTNTGPKDEDRTVRRGLMTDSITLLSPNLSESTSRRFRCSNVTKADRQSRRLISQWEMNSKWET